MVTGGSGGFTPRTGANLSTFADTVVIPAIKAAEPVGIDLDGAPSLVLGRTTGLTAFEIEYAEKEFKKAIRFSNRSFHNGVAGWCLIKAGPDRYYHVVAECYSSRVIPRAKLASLTFMDDHHTRRWKTETESMQEIHSAYGQTLIIEGNKAGNAAMVAEGEKVMDTTYIVNTRLQALGQKLGLLIDVRGLANTVVASASRRVRWLFGKRAKRIAKLAHQLEKEINLFGKEMALYESIYVKGALMPPPSP